jgi:hypothetical protein
MGRLELLSDGFSDGIQIAIRGDLSEGEELLGHGVSCER